MSRPLTWSNTSPRRLNLGCLADTISSVMSIVEDDEASAAARGFYMAPPVLHPVDMTLEVRPATEADRSYVVSLAHRLEEGVAAWRDRSAVAEAARSWVETSMSRIGRDEQGCFVVEEYGQVIGFVSVGETCHWSGTSEAYIGELVVSRQAEGRGVGRALVDEAAAWGRSRGCRRIALATGAANTAARQFYRSLNFEEEEVRLSRRL